MRLYFDSVRLVVHTVIVSLTFLFFANTTIAKVQDICVLLDELRSGSWNISSPGGFRLTRCGGSAVVRAPSQDLVVTVRRGGQVRVNGKLMRHDNMTLTPQRGRLQFSGKSYDGVLQLVVREGTAYLVNVLPLEEYVSSVLRTESWPGWPLEVNKALAIASRSYALAMRRRAKKNNRPYDLKNTNKHQTYAGAHDCDLLKKAVEMTHGVYLAHEDKPIIAMFDACCGGVVPANVANFDFTRAPYLARKKACTHCKRCKIYSWQVSWPLEMFEKMFRPRVVSLGGLRDVRVAQKDSAGLSKNVMLKGRKGQLQFSGDRIYSLLKEVKSYCFDVTTKNGTVTMSGRGFGHHIGLCQWGAREMVRDGWNYKRVLQFYYPGTQLKRIA